MALARPDILGKFLVIQDMMESMPDAAHTASFLRQALRDVPGLNDMHLCIGGTVYPPHDGLKRACARCQETGTIPSGADAEKLAGVSGTVLLPIATSRKLFGLLALSVGNRADLAPYEAFLRNIANVVATDLETRDHIVQIDRANAALKEFGTELGARVAQRTAELSQRNAELATEIRQRKVIEGALRESEERFRAVADVAQVAIVLADAQDKIIYCNPATGTMFGYAAGELEGKPLHGSLAPERFRAQAAAGRSHFAETGQGAAVGKILEFCALHKSGKEFPVELSVSALRLRDQWCAVGTVRDISRRKGAEVAFARADRALRMLTAVNGMVIRAESEQPLFREVCEAIVAIGGYRMANIGLCEHDAGKTFRLVASAGADGGFLQGTRISWGDDEYGRGPTGTAIRTGMPQVNRDFATNPQMKPWRAEALKRGYGSSIALSLKRESEAFGALSIYAVERDAFNDDEVKLCVELADNVAYGVSALRDRAEREEANRRQRKGLEEAVQALASTLEIRDPYTAGHQRNVGRLASAVAQKIGLSADQIRGLLLAGVIHDVGKIVVPAEILSKPGKLLPAEFDLIRAHAQAGYDIVKGIDFPWPIGQMILQHHERLDGSGYPHGLKGDAILIEAKILAVADVVEAMISHRPYRAALGIDAALAHVVAEKGRLYDPIVVDACAALFRAGAITFDSANSLTIASDVQGARA